VAGARLFMTRATTFGALSLVRLELALAGAGVVSALALPSRSGWRMTGASPRRRAVHAAVSIVLWLAVLAAKCAIALA
jgi:hypothetical protein